MALDPADKSGTQYGLRQVVEDDLPVILSLLNTGLAETEATRKTGDFWHWKHRSSPYGESYVGCATAGEGSELVALRALMPWSFADASGRTYRAFRPVDTVTRPDHQRRGLFSTLTKRAIRDLEADGADFIFNTPNEQSRPGYLKMGWEVVGSLPLYARLTNWTGLGSVLLGKTPQPPHGYALESWDEFVQRFSSLERVDLVRSHEESRPRTGLRSVRSADFLSWRYGQHPNIDYDVFSQSDGRGKLVGFLVGRRVRGFRGLPAFLLTELFVQEACQESLHALVKAFISSRCAAYVVTHVAKNTIEHEVLESCRFRRLPTRGYILAARSLSTPVSQLTETDGWDLTLCELEGI